MTPAFTFRRPMGRAPMSSSHAPSEPGRGFPRFGLAFFDFGISNSFDQTLDTLSPNALCGKPYFGDLQLLSGLPGMTLDASLRRI
ncbi:hypothetical protein G6L37_17580 [Agrobacterium rubi]|uniref:hypothetical protein n=1 Tax=Agrobacterium rubi TaxID=28099 RepID=UPI001571F518|nr:hypothetical protein [Agrobacterium rubi]NTF07965.1 hypothetical protein [Agrobacterium rubi]NTF20209.1 hypothetical protein [Agrobacterium rubi]NTF27180.1 hypothetical protein [Agrobacterium rubi]